MTPQRDNSSSAAATQLWERHEYEMMGFDVQEDGDDGNQLFDGDIFEDSDGQTNSDFNGEYNQYSATTSSRNISKET